MKFGFEVADILSNSKSRFSYQNPHMRRTKDRGNSSSIGNYQTSFLIEKPSLGLRRKVEIDGGADSLSMGGWACWYLLNGSMAHAHKCSVHVREKPKWGCPKVPRPAWLPRQTGIHPSPQALVVGGGQGVPRPADWL